jgi:HK97 family phage major capsid protein
VENTNLTTEEVISKLDGLFTEKMQNVPTQEDVAGLKSELDSLKGLEEKSQEIEKAIAKFEGRIEAMSEKAITPAVEKLSVSQSLMKTYADNIEAIKGAVEKGGKINLDVKTTTITNDYTGDYALTDFDSQVDRVVNKRYGILENVNSGATSGKFVTYVQQTASTRTEWTAEGDAKRQGEPQWSEISEEVKKIASYVKVSKEMLEDLSFIRAEIDNDLMEQVRVGIEQALLTGTGTGAEIKGLLTTSMGLPTFGAGTFALAVQDANISDLMRVVKAQIEGANHTPTHIVLNPEDIAKLQLTKASDGAYTYPMFLPTQSGDGEMIIAGMRVISSTYMTADNYLVGDFSKVNVRFRNNIAMSVGLDQDDFTKNMVTILAEARLVQYVKNNDKPAFVYGEISSDVASILKP